MLIRPLGIMDVTLAEWIIMLEGTEEFKPPESCCHSNYRHLYQRLLPIASWFYESRHQFLGRSKINHILTGLGPPDRKSVD